MKPVLSHEQMMLIIERATRERNAAVAELVATLPRKLIAALARSAEAFRQLRDSAQRGRQADGELIHLRCSGASTSI